METKISVLTLVKGRHAALLNLVKGLSLNSTAAIELIVVHMNEEPCTLPLVAFPVRSLSLYTDEQLPLAKARNLAVSSANAENCVFLDVDCIPAANFISLYQQAFRDEDILWSGAVRYLRDGFPEDLEPLQLEKWSDPDPVRSNLPGLSYELFWSLNFGCSKTIFYKIGQFDEGYGGYGAEDTDFSFSARKQGIPLRSIPAVAYHQPHAGYDPPLNHLEDIVKNARVFHAKWQRWPMEGWLKKFQLLGYVSWTEDELSVVSIPAPAELEKYLKKTT